jgi:hypothetical protein
MALLSFAISCSNFEKFGSLIPTPANSPDLFSVGNQYLPLHMEFLSGKLREVKSSCK